MRHVREWPRLVALAAVLAALLVVIGVVVASAAGSGGGGGKSLSSTTPLLRAPKNDQSALVQSQAKTISGLRATVATQRGQIAGLQQKLKRERALHRIRVHSRAWHHHKHHSPRR
jgi:negative regulator of sigma E activity